MDNQNNMLVYTKGLATIDDLPDEVLEFILCFLPPYKDLEDCMWVCKRWYHLANDVIKKTTQNLVKAITEFNIEWKNITPVDMAPTITKRFSHAACVHENSMYIFGGCTTNATAFNDLWRFDLSKRQWIRPLAMGTYPVPKAYTSMTCYKDNLILFGGWTYPSPSQYFQHWAMFNEIHFYNITTNRWILINTSNEPPPMAGHSAIVNGDTMIVFGGLTKSSTNTALIQCSNDVWVLDLITMLWRKQPTTKPRPSARYAQSLIGLDSSYIMILGGAQTPHSRFVYNDCWVLNMEGKVWSWKEIVIKNREWSAANIWCNPACRVGDKVVSLSRCQTGTKPFITSAVRLAARNNTNEAPISVRVEQYARRPVDRDHNVNGRRGVLPQRNKLTDNIENEIRPSTSSQDAGDSNGSGENGESKSVDSADVNLKRKQRYRMNGLKIVRQLQDSNRFKMAAFACDIPSINIQRLENENHRQNDRIEQRREIAVEQVVQPVKKIKRNTLSLHVLDISMLLNGSMDYVSWLRPSSTELSSAPEELVMYSLVQGKGELIMFGGVTNDVNILNSFSSSHHQYSNSLHFISPPRDII